MAPMPGKGRISMSIDIASMTKDANAGDLEVQLQLAEMYETGFGVPIDRGQAAYWYRKAAEQGSARAQSTLGQIYIRGVGVPEDHGEAVESDEVWHGGSLDRIGAEKKPGTAVSGFFSARILSKLPPCLTSFVFTALP